MSPETDQPAPLQRVEQNDGSFTVPAEVLATAFALLPADVPRLMREGQITSRLEQGQDADAGTYRLTFYHGAQALRLIIDGDGWIVKRSRFPVTRRTP